MSTQNSNHYEVCWKVDEILVCNKDLALCIELKWIKIGSLFINSFGINEQNANLESSLMGHKFFIVVTPKKSQSCNLCKLLLNYVLDWFQLRYLGWQILIFGTRPLLIARRRADMLHLQHHLLKISMTWSHLLKVKNAKHKTIKCHDSVDWSFLLWWLYVAIWSHQWAWWWRI